MDNCEDCQKNTTGMCREHTEIHRLTARSSELTFWGQLNVLERERRDTQAAHRAAARKQR